MITAVLALIAVTGSVQEPIEFKLGWKQGDKFAYTIGHKGSSSNLETRLNLTVSKADEIGVTLEWPSAKMTNGPTLAAGSVMMNRHGRITTKGSVTDASGHLMMLILPEKPVAVGDEFKVTFTLYRTTFDMTGKLVKIVESKGRVAHFSFEGVFRTGGVGLKFKQNSVFDMTREIFTSAEFFTETSGLTHKRYLKLIEKDAGG